METLGGLGGYGITSIIVIFIAFMLFAKFAKKIIGNIITVSYTHLTLPTTSRV